MFYYAFSISEKQWGTRKEKIKDYVPPLALLIVFGHIEMFDNTYTHICNTIINYKI